ncbi:HNH endonuclease [Pseudomonas sp. H1h]|uniref:HNH endonuclease n=1 Tax=Pseudomonas sp. H1h TaxID=1397280 RepID=UPI0004696DE7|nr:HNH endonuclease [Pseudomonas sp. H1h]
MIFVDRNGVKPPASLTVAGKAGDNERKHAKIYYALPIQDRPKRKKKAKGKVDEPEEEKTIAFTFSAYKGEDVKEALEVLFNKKCAYCESSYKSVISVQIEHFRPKKRVAEDPTHEGYWWLASSWSNLLPSCVHCNGTEYHLTEMLENEPPYSQEFKNGAYRLGKYDYFPIGGARACSEQDDLKLEKAFLIDPTERNPENHLQWIVQNSLSLVAPKKIGEDWDIYGFTTYRVFGLNRRNLVEERTALMRQVENELGRVRDLLYIAAKLEADATRDSLIDVAFRALADMREKASPSQPYSMMVKTLLEDEEARLMEEFSTIFE